MSLHCFFNAFKQHVNSERFYDVIKSSIFNCSHGDTNVIESCYHNELYIGVSEMILFYNLNSR